MSYKGQAAIQVRFEPTNPGQFFACCGLLELADRLWGGAMGWFDEELNFRLRPTESVSNWDAATLLKEVTACSISNTMTSSQRQRRQNLSAIAKKLREAEPSLEMEKKDLDAIYREAPVVLGLPFRLTLDWFLDRYTGGKELKTWAGQQAVVDIASGMRGLIDGEAPPQEWLSHFAPGDSVPFNFDSDLGGAGSDLDLGFSIDPLRPSGLTVRTRPLLEYAAFVGLQRFRPKKSDSNGVYQFSIWRKPLLPEAATAVTCGCVECLATRTFQFRLLYRTKYLKSFLPAMQV